MRLIKNPEAGKRKVQTKARAEPMVGWTQVGEWDPAKYAQRLHQPAPFAFALDDNHSILLHFALRDPEPRVAQASMAEVVQGDFDWGRAELAYFKRQADGRLLCRMHVTYDMDLVMSSWISRGTHWRLGDLRQEWEKAVRIFKQLYLPTEAK